MTDSPTVTFRPPLTGLIAVWGLAVCVTPVAFGVPGLQVLYVLPLVITVWLLRTRTVVGPETVVARRLLGSRSVAWAEMNGLRVDARSRIWAVLHDGEEVWLPTVRARDLPVLAKVSRGRLSDPLAT
ncbi:MAG TPA: PH domain-containing protein [Pseudonocardiaceae bacterium]|nr:PH domain-containing protein [Pseudonocardiaceae bacterium]